MCVFFYLVECHNQLMKDLKALVCVLDHFESTAQLAKTVVKEPQVCVTNFSFYLCECIKASF